MRLVVDARMMGAGKTRGIGRYIKEITDAMRQQMSPSDELLLIQPNIPWYSIAEQLKMPRILAKAKADLVWIPHWNVPIFYGCPFAITVHDLLLRHQPASAKASTRSPFIAWVKRLGHRFILWQAMKRAAVILVPTQAVADDIKQYYPNAVSRVIVTGEGMTELPKTNVSSITGKYLLYVGSAYPHKRLDLLVDAWSELSKQHPDLSLVITGKDDVFLSRIKSQVQNNGSDRVLFAGSVDDQELGTLYANASALIFPSSFEGFGLPPIEALSTGTPVVVSDIPVLREVLPQNGVFFFKLGDKDAMIASIEAVLAQGSAAREAASLGGEEVRTRHRWEDAAKRSLAALRAIAHNH